MKKIVSILVIFTFVFILAGCTNPLNRAGKIVQNTNNKINATTKKKADVNLNEDYFFMIKGKKFKAGDKINNIASVGLKQDSRVVDQKVSKNTYLIGGGYIYNSDDKRVISITPFNSSSEEILAKDAEIGGFEAGEYEYSVIPQEVLDLDISIVGGIKFGSTYDELVSVFGETTNTFHSESLGYTTYTYKSDKVYRSFEFTVDKNNKVSRIRWQNLEYNR